jgi:AAA family ATP:ADP antiporter
MTAAADAGAAPPVKRAGTVSFGPGERLPAILAFGLYFCVLGGYFAVRPVRDTFASILGRQRVSELFFHTWMASLAIVPVYGWLCTRLRRQTFLPWIYGGVALALAACATVFLVHEEQNVFVGEFFYVMISVLNLFLVSVMWSFLLELFTAEQTRRLFGFIAAGGTTGALVGPYLTSLIVGSVGNAGVLYLGAGLFVAAIVCQRLLLRAWATAPWRDDPAAAAQRERPLGGNPFAGVWLVLKSPYLLGIALYVLGVSAVNTFLYFDQIDLLQQTYADTRDRTAVLARIDTTVQALTVLLQLFATGRIAARWGPGALLTAVPILMVLAMGTLAAWHTFAALVTVIIIRRVGEYALVRPGREMLYSPLPTETKYKAKNFVDVPVYRGGDWITGRISNLDWKGLPTALIGAGIAVLWAGVGWWLGRRVEHRAEAAGKAP